MMVGRLIVSVIGTPSIRNRLVDSGLPAMGMVETSLWSKNPVLGMTGITFCDTLITVYSFRSSLVDVGGAEICWPSREFDVEPFVLSSGGPAADTRTVCEASPTSSDTSTVID